MNLSRKDFFRKGFLTLGNAVLNPVATLAGGRDPLACHLRPPGFAADSRKLCETCSLCVHACPEQCLERQEGVAGPVFRPRLGECTFCLECVTACQPGVLRPEHGEVRLGLAETDNDRCLAQRGGCFSCLERCPEEAIAIEVGVGIRVDGERCTGCGACEYVCPLEHAAIRVQPLPGLP